jgi:hypothetical protein
MPRKKKTAKSAEPAETAMPQAAPAITAATESEPHSERGDRPLPATDAGNTTELNRARMQTPEATDGRAGFARAVAGNPEYTGGPRPVLTVNLSVYSGGPAMHLQRSLRFKQMQIRFDQGQPDERHLAMLKRAGWSDRTESEGVWTKQIDENARWQSVAGMEREFKAVANAIREEKGMEPVLAGLSLA